MVLYTKEHRINLFGTSHGIVLTYPLSKMEINVGDFVKVEVDDNKVMTIKKVERVKK